MTQDLAEYIYTHCDITPVETEKLLRASLPTCKDISLLAKKVVQGVNSGKKIAQILQELKSQGII